MRMVRLITSIVFLFSTTQLFAQQYIANNGEISFFDLEALSNKLSKVHDIKTKTIALYVISQHFKL